MYASFETSYSDFFKFSLASLHQQHTKINAFEFDEVIFHTETKRLLQALSIHLQANHSRHSMIFEISHLNQHTGCTPFVAFYFHFLIASIHNTSKIFIANLILVRPVQCYLCFWHTNDIKKTFSKKIPKSVYFEFRYTLFDI